MYEVHYEPVVLPTMVTIKEAAKASGLAVYRVRQLCKEGKVKHIHCGRRILIQLQSLRDYLEAGDPPAAISPKPSDGIRKIAL